MKKFKWAPGQPKTEVEFERLMRAVDAALNAEGVLPWQRPLHLPIKLAQALGWSGNIYPPKVLASEPGFVGDLLMAKAHHWYEQVYGDALKTDMAYGHAPVRLGQGIWRVRATRCYGQVRFFIDPNLENQGVALASPRSGRKEASLNVLTQVEGPTPALLSRLSPPELRKFFEFFMFMHAALRWRERLPDTELFRMARGDYDECTADVLGHRYGQARWAAQQAVEKTIKGFLTLGGTAFPKGQDGHDLKFLAELLLAKHGVSVAPSLLAMASCSTAIRYGKTSTEEEALQANHAVLGVLEQLSVSREAAAIIQSAAHTKT